MKKIILIGGSNVDYIGTSVKKLIPNVSNVGKVSISFGGVMRNICENLLRLNNKITFVSAIGNDDLGNKMLKELKALNCHVITPNTTLPTGTYLAINNSNHDLNVAICDNRIIEELNVNYLKSLENELKEYEYIALDANLSLEAINYIFKAYSDKKFLIESISPYKVIKFKEHLKNIYLIKCNLFEARALCDDNSLSAMEACKILLNKGIKKVVVSAASDNIYYGEDNNVNCFKINKVDSFVNTTGCGDALFSGIVDRIIANDTLYNAISLGHKLSLLTLQSEKATTKEVSKYQHD
ncbi:MAG: carbohydrate kinase family protein [Candidatus Caccosoma sp.]|nr:carbohydrate kinase family protein [Candidatus Caccosoma sp.]